MTTTSKSTHRPNVADADVTLLLKLAKHDQLTEDQRKELYNLALRLAVIVGILPELSNTSWSGRVDHQSGAFDPNERREMGG